MRGLKLLRKNRFVFLLLSKGKKDRVWGKKDGESPWRWKRRMRNKEKVSQMVVCAHSFMIFILCRLGN
jgi:hypothetical protein